MIFSELCILAVSVIILVFAMTLFGDADMPEWVDHRTQKWFRIFRVFALSVGVVFTVDGIFRVANAVLEVIQ